MTPAARIQATIEIIDALGTTEMRAADRFLRDWFRAHRFAGSKDRAAVTEGVYDVLRHRASLAWRMESEEPRSLVIASLITEGKSLSEIEKLFSGEGYGPAPLNEEERKAIASPPADEPPLSVQGEFPLWLQPELDRAFGKDLLPEMQAMFERAPVDLRVNSLRAERRAMLDGLRSLDIQCDVTPFSPFGIRVPSAEGLSALEHTRFFQTGAFEFQDEASQLAALLCGAKPGDRVLDLAAGAGGKSLALAALMRNKGEILAYDANPARLKQLAPRARRAGASIITVAETRGGPKWGNGKFDIVLVDAPCSGSGTWRRNPETKWRLTRDRLRELIELQNWLVDDGARHTKPGGSLVYVTCSLLPSENEDVVSAFLTRNQEFRIVPVEIAWRTLLGEPPAFVNRYFRGSPLASATDGLFVCIMARS
ncbi:MAG TPA: RsmB/NOP family class I SAM-dependent RNA methyltransferase [Micropepsaceae bacterium]|nr:RsmB/NOP family class I SAM-dependent RNA methyltransferase [Micropepsaceae bacterium]